MTNLNLACNKMPINIMHQAADKAAYLHSQIRTMIINSADLSLELEENKRFIAPGMLCVSTNQLQNNRALYLSHTLCSEKKHTLTFSFISQ